MPIPAHIALALVHGLVALSAGGLVVFVALWIGEPAGIALGVMIGIATAMAGAASQARFVRELREAGGMVTGTPLRQAEAAVELYRTRMSGGRMALEAALSPESAAYDMRRQRGLLERLAADRHAERWELAGREIEKKLGRATAADKRFRRGGLGGEDEQETLRQVERAIRSDGFSLIARPIVQLPTRKPMILDFAFAMREQDGTLREPDEWVSLAGDAGLSPFIENLLLIRLARRLRDAARRNTRERAYLHLSGAALNESGVLREIVATLDGDGALPDRLVLGLSQRDWPELSDEALSALFHLAGGGYQLALDQPQDIDFDFDELRARRIRTIVAPSALLLVRQSTSPTAKDIERFRDRMNANAIDLIIDRIDSEDRYRDVMDFQASFAAGALFGGYAAVEGRAG